MKINQLAKNEVEIVLQKLGKHHDFERVSKMLLKDFDEEAWISALHDVDPEHVQDIVNKLDLKNQRGETTTKLDIVTSYLSSPRSPSEMSPSAILLGGSKTDREDSNENNSTEIVTGHHSNIMPTDEDHL